MVVCRGVRRYETYACPRARFKKWRWYDKPWKVVWSRACLGIRWARRDPVPHVHFYVFFSPCGFHACPRPFAHLVLSVCNTCILYNIFLSHCSISSHYIYIYIYIHTYICTYIYIYIWIQHHIMFACIFICFHLCYTFVWVLVLWWLVGGLIGMKRWRALGHAWASEDGMTNPGCWYDRRACQDFVQKAWLYITRHDFVLEGKTLY